MLPIPPLYYLRLKEALKEATWAKKHEQQPITSWVLTKEQEKILRHAQRKMERKMLEITWRDRKRATWVR